MSVDSGETLGPCQNGEICVKGPTVMKGNWGSCQKVKRGKSKKAKTKDETSDYREKQTSERMNKNKDI